MIDFRLGRWEEALADVEMVDAVITDPPYGARTHKSQFNGKALSSGKYTRSDGRMDASWTRKAIPYENWEPAQVADFVRSWAPRCQGWFGAFTSHDLVDAYADALIDAGRYVFAPLPFYQPGSTVRLAGDGPSSWTCWIVVARPRLDTFKKWGTLPGGYVASPGSGKERAKGMPGTKPLAGMRSVIRDYTRPGDLVCDPYAGGATTLIAAAMEGRRAIGCEMDPDTYAKAKKRIAKGYTPDLFV